LQEFEFMFHEPPGNREHVGDEVVALLELNIHPGKGFGYAVTAGDDRCVPRVENQNENR
jgi:hypothetical protein